MSIIDNHPVTVNCPQCKQEINGTIGQIKRDKQLICPICGKIGVDPKDLVEIDRTVEKFKKDIAGLSKTFTFKF